MQMITLQLLGIAYLLWITLHSNLPKKNAELIMSEMYKPFPTNQTADKQKSKHINCLQRFKKPESKFS